MVGEQIAHYRIVEKIGQGGMGEVYRARDTKLGREIALKILPPHLADDPARRARFEREARAVAALQHPNIVTIHSVEESEGLHFLTMELVQGRTLADAIPDRGFPLGRFLEVAVPLAEAVGSAHAKGIMHRDLKPTNIMIDSEGRPKILDFGLAKLLEVGEGHDASTVAMEADPTEEGRIVGTVAYMSPEQAQGKAIDDRSDIFSLGIILYEMATGERPFRGETKITTLSSIIKDTPPPVSERNPVAPPELVRIISRCLAKEPRRRYQSALDLGNDLEEIRSASASGVAATTSARPRTSRPGRILTVAAAAVVVGILGFLLLRPGGERPDAPDADHAGEKSIAVLPFVNMSADPDNEYFSDGLSEELLNVLAKVTGLRVAARTSSFHFKGHTGSVSEIGEQLGVATILEGSVRKAGNQVRITAQLVNADDGFHLWSETYDRELDDIFAIQEDIATEVVGALKVTLLGAEASRIAKRPTRNMEAYDAYLLGTQRIAKRTSTSLKEAETYLKKAIDLDPEFALAYSRLADTYLLMNTYANVPADEARSKADPLVRKALELDDQQGEAWISLAAIQWQREELEEAEASFRRGLELAPNYSSGHMWYADFLGAVSDDRWDEVIALKEKAVALDPLSVIAVTALGQDRAWDGLYDEAIALFERAIEIDPSFPRAHAALARLYEDQYGRLDDAADLYRKAIDLDRGNLRYRFDLARVYRQMGRPGDAEAIYLKAIETNPGAAGGHAELANLYSYNGRHDEAVRWARKWLELETSPDDARYRLSGLYLDLGDVDAAEEVVQGLTGLRGLKARYRLHCYRSELKEAEEVAREILEKEPYESLWRLSLIYMMTGRKAEARGLWTRSSDAYLLEADPIPDIGNHNVWPAVEVAHVLLKTGDTERALGLLQKAEAFVMSLPESQRRWEYPYLISNIYALQGRSTEALGVLQRMADEGRDDEWWWMERDAPYFDSIRFEPAFRKIMDQFRADMERARQALASDTP